MSLRIVTALLCLSLAACGFQLRRELELPASLHTLRVETPEQYGTLQRGLEDAVQRAGAVLGRGDGKAVLRVTRAELSQRALSVGATGRVQEFELVYLASIELFDADGKEILPSQSIELTRDYSFDTAQSLGSPGEEELLREELERDMVGAILRRVDAAVRAL